MRIGMTGAAVTGLQKELQTLGLYDGEVDGWYGYVTSRSVSDLQNRLGVRPTGNFDHETQVAYRRDQIAFAGDAGQKIVRIPRRVY